MQLIINYISIVVLYKQKCEYIHVNLTLTPKYIMYEIKTDKKLNKRSPHSSPVAAELYLSDPLESHFLDLRATALQLSCPWLSDIT